MVKMQIIGTSHIASQSVNQIKRAFNAETKPDIVAIELDAARAKQIFDAPATPKMRDIFELGFMGYSFALIGGFVQRKFGAKVGLKPGEDMRTAIKEANHHARPLFFIDQPIQKTLRNISKKMSFWEKSKLAFYALGIVFVPLVGIFRRERKTLDLKKVPSGDVIEESIGALRKKFPGLYAALITDRNTYMVRNLKYLAARYPDKTILVVVGAGHKDAICEALTTPAVAS